MMAYETFEEFLDATRSSRPRPKMVDAWLAGRDSAREYYTLAFEAMTENIARAETAEAALAACQHDLAAMIEQKEYFRQCWEVAEATLAEYETRMAAVGAELATVLDMAKKLQTPCVWRKDDKCLASACGFLTTLTADEFLFCPGCGHPVEVAP